MTLWQADFYKRPTIGGVVWELSICDPTRSLEYTAQCPQSEANSNWVTTQLQLACGGQLPDVIQVFRPQSLSLIAAAGRSLGINVEPTRRTLALKQWLKEKQLPLRVEKPPPTPLPEKLWGEEWLFASLGAGDLVDIFTERPVPILHIPEYLTPINLGLASTISVPGVIIYGGRQSMSLARWLNQAVPVAVNYVAGQPHGLVLEAGLGDRWVLVTFADSEVAAAAQTYERRKLPCHGLHFLLIQPDDSGMTYSGFWLLQDEELNFT